MHNVLRLRLRPSPKRKRDARPASSSAGGPSPLREAQKLAQPEAMTTRGCPITGADEDTHSHSHKQIESTPHHWPSAPVHVGALPDGCKPVSPLRAKERRKAKRRRKLSEISPPLAAAGSGHSASSDASTSSSASSSPPHTRLVNAVDQAALPVKCVESLSRKTISDPAVSALAASVSSVSRETSASAPTGQRVPRAASLASIPPNRANTEGVQCGVLPQSDPSPDAAIVLATRRPPTGKRKNSEEIASQPAKAARGSIGRPFITSVTTRSRSPLLMAASTPPARDQATAARSTFCKAANPAASSSSLPPPQMLPPPVAPGSTPLKPVRCDKCDGPHDSARCPHYKKARDRHPDAQPGRKGIFGGASTPLLLRKGRVARQPGDGSCLFHSLRYGLNRMSASERHVAAVPSAAVLRQQLAQWVVANAQHRIADTPVHKWVRWDSGVTPQVYAARIARSGWGGGIEMAACSHLMGVNVWVYEKCRGGYERISCFDAPARCNSGRGVVGTVHILYQGGVHYDAFLPDVAELAQAVAHAERRSKRSAQSPAASSGAPCGGIRQLALPVDRRAVQWPAGKVCGSTSARTGHQQPQRKFGGGRRIQKRPWGGQMRR